MIVVAIIAILASVAIPNFLKYRSNVHTQMCVNNMKQLQFAAECWRTSQKDPLSVPTLDQLVGTDTTKYIHKAIADFGCPIGGQYTIGALEGVVITVSCPNVGQHADHVLR